MPVGANRGSNAPRFAILRLGLRKRQRIPRIVDQDIVYRLTTESPYPHPWNYVISYVVVSMATVRLETMLRANIVGD